MQTVACPKAGEVQLLCTTREVTERARTPDCGVSVEEKICKNLKFSIIGILVILLTLTLGGGTPAERQDRGPRPPDQTYEFEDGAPAEGQGQARKKSGSKKKSGAIKE